MKKYCVKCGKQFEATGREVICPSCKQAAAEDAKRAAVMKAKRASWSGESVPVRISGRASTVIRAYGAEKRLPFAAALDSLLQSTACFKGMQMAWEEVEPYRSHRRDKATSTAETAQDVPQDVPQASKQAAGKQNATGKPQEATKAAKVANKNTTSKATSKAAGKAASKKG